MSKWAHVLAHDSRAAGWVRTEYLTTPIENFDEQGDGRYKLFYAGQTPVAGIFWHPEVDGGNAHVVYGGIFQEYAARGLCAGALGYPTHDEQTVSVVGGGDGQDRVSFFVHGALKWDAQTQRVMDYEDLGRRIGGRWA